MENVLWGAYTLGPQTDRMLQSNNLVQDCMGLKVIQKSKGIVIQEGPKRKRTTRPPLVGKRKKVAVKEMTSEESDKKETHEQSPLKRRKRIVAEMGRQLLFDEPEPEP